MYFPSGLTPMFLAVSSFDPSHVTLEGLQHSAYVRFSLLALSSVFFLVDPFAALPTFLAVTAGSDKARRRRMAWKASLTALVVLCAFAIAGQYIFRMFGNTLPAFEIAGGVILLLIGLDMLNAKRSETQETDPETQAAAEKEDAGIVPLGIPMLAGPGSITSVMVLVGQAQGDWKLLGSNHRSDRDHGGPSAISCWVTPIASLRCWGRQVFVFWCGLWVCCWWPLAVQYFVNGMVDLGVVARPND